MKEKWKELSYMIVNKNVWISFIILCSCIREYPSFMMVRTRTIRDRKMIIMFIIMLWWSLCLNGYPTSAALENARPTIKGAWRCANRLVGSHSHVWTICRIVNTHLINSFSIAARNIDWYDRSYTWLNVFASNLNSGVTYWVFLIILKPRATAISYKGNTPLSD